MPPRKGKARVAAPADGEKEFDLGPPNGKVMAKLSSAWNIIGTKVSMPGNFWPGVPAKPPWPCTIDGYCESMQHADGVAPGYIITPEEEDHAYPYAVKQNMLFKLLTKKEQKRISVDSDDEEDAAMDDAAPRAARAGAAAAGRPAAALDASRPVPQHTFSFSKNKMHSLYTDLPEESLFPSLAVRKVSRRQLE